MVKTDMRIGGLTLAERQTKVLRFLHKKKNRLGKKFHYPSRQVVASGRLRVKGRFIKKEEAFEMLDIVDHNVLSRAEIQTMLNERFHVDAQPKDPKTKSAKASPIRAPIREKPSKGLSFFGQQHL